MNDASNVVSFARRKKALNARSALAYLAKVAEGHPEAVIEVESITHLGTLLGWERPRTSKQLKAWETSGQVTVDRAGTSKLVIRILPGRHDFERAGTPSQSTRARRAAERAKKRAVERAKERAVDRAEERAIDRADTRAVDRVNPANIDNGSTTYTDHLNATGTPNVRETASENVPADVRSGTPSGTPSARVPGTPPARVPGTLSRRLFGHADRDVVDRAEDLNWHAAGRHGDDDGGAAARSRWSGLDVLAVIAALALAVVAGWMSVRGMIVLFPGDPVMAFLLGVALEGAKLITAGWMGHRWGELGWGHRIPLILAIAGVASINAMGVYSQLVHAHLSERGAMQAGLETRDAEAGARIEVVQGKLADIDRRLALIDGTVDAASRRGNAKTSAALIQQQKGQRAVLAEERQQVARSLADLKAERAAGAARGRAAETEAAPIMYVAELLGIQRGGEEVIRWLIALIVASTDPFALALAAAISARRRRRA